MAKWGFLIVVALVAAHQAAAARVFPGDNGLTDEKNVINFGGVGTYGGVGARGIPYGGVAGGMGTGGLTPGSGFAGIGGIYGTDPNGNIVAVGGTIPGNIGSIGGPGGGVGGALPSP